MRLPLTLLVIALATAEGLSAQTPPLRGRMAGPVAERFFDEDSRFLVLGYRWSDLRRSGRPRAARTARARLAGRADLARQVYVVGDETYPYWNIGLSLPAFSAR